MLPVKLQCLRTLSQSYKGFFMNILFKNVQCVSKETREMSSSTLGLDGAERLVWIDMEMTGLDPETCHILEVACIITDGHLNVISEGPNLVVNQSEEVLQSMNDWCLIHHRKSGLWKASTESKITLSEAARKVTEFVTIHTPAGKCPLAGNSVYGDRLFIRKYIPQLEEHLHYRIVDVSTIKELCRRWFPREFENAPVKTFAHRALPDLRESIQELKYYKDTIFNLHAEPMGKVTWC